MTEFESEIAVVGGVYGEFITEPAWNDVYGSGLRGAALMASNGAAVSLFAPIDETLRPAAEAVAIGYGVAFRWLPRECPIWFRYTHPLSVPGIDNLDQRVGSYTVRASKVALVYGMLECSPNVEADRIVYDPQSPRGTGGVSIDRLKSGCLAITANATEISSLGQNEDVLAAAASLAERSHADVIVVKNGPLGASVLHRGAWSHVGPFESQTVWKLGSGDVFSAAFALAWGVHGRPPVEAARVASAAASYWCANRAMPSNIEGGVVLEIASGPELKPRSELVGVYLAGPFFTLSERWLVNVVRRSLTQCGARVFSPLHDVGLGGDEVAEKDIDGLQHTEVLLALLDGSDAGTVFEVGYATAKGMAVVGFADAPEANDFKMLRGLGISITADLTTAVYRAIWSGMRD